MRDADRVIGLVEAADLPSPRLILNRIRPELVRRGEMMTQDDVIEILAVDLLGIVPDDETIVISTNRGEAAVHDRTSRAGQAYTNIARRLLGEDVPFLMLGHRRRLARPDAASAWAAGGAAPLSGKGHAGCGIPEQPVRTAQPPRQRLGWPSSACSWCWCRTA